MGYWTDRQQEIGRDLSNHPWVKDLASATRRCRPKLYRELKAAGDWESYLSVKVYEALEEARKLEEGGYPQCDAEETALRELLTIKEDAGENERVARGTFNIFLQFLEAQSKANEQQKPEKDQVNRKEAP